MKLTVLCDNNTFIDNKYLGEPGLSFYIENANDKILFDVGWTYVFKENARRMGIDLNNVNKIAISHGHNDHTYGFKYFAPNKNATIYYAKDDCFDKKYVSEIDISAPFTKKKFNKIADLKLIEKATEISPNLFYLGIIPRHFDFEHDAHPTLTTIKDNVLQPDFVEEDTALVFNGKQGLTIITACSHSGICNIVDYAQQLFPNKNIFAIIGGFHIFECNEKAKKQ